MLQRLFERLINRAYSIYAAFALVLVLFVLVCPPVILAPTLRLRRAFGRAGVRLAMLVIGVPFRVRGLENVPAGPCIAVANHASYVDGLILTAALPGKFTFVVQDGAARWPYIGLTIKRMGAAFINRFNAREGAAQTRGLIRRVQGGESLAIFAEGTFKADTGLMPFKNGAFMIAARAGVPVLPVALRGTRRLFGGGRKTPRWSSVSVEIAPPISASQDPHTLRDRARAAVLLHCGEPDLATRSMTQAEAA